MRRRASASSASSGRSARLATSAISSSTPEVEGEIAAAEHVLGGGLQRGEQRAGATGLAVQRRPCLVRRQRVRQRRRGAHQEPLGQLGVGQLGPGPVGKLEEGPAGLLRWGLAELVLGEERDGLAWIGPGAQLGEPLHGTGRRVRAAGEPAQGGLGRPQLAGLGEEVGVGEQNFHLTGRAAPLVEGGDDGGEQGERFGA